MIYNQKVNGETPLYDTWINAVYTEYLPLNSFIPGERFHRGKMEMELQSNFPIARVRTVVDLKQREISSTSSVDSLIWPWEWGGSAASLSLVPLLFFSSLSFLTVQLDSVEASSWLGELGLSFRPAVCIRTPTTTNVQRRRAKRKAHEKRENESMNNVSIYNLEYGILIVLFDG